MSAIALVRVKRGSTWMMVAPLSLACITQRNATGWHSAMLEPSMTMQSEPATLPAYVVAAPRPSRVPKPGTLELCQIRAWFSIATTPRPRMSFCWTWFHSPSSVAPPSEKMAVVTLTSVPFSSRDERLIPHFLDQLGHAVHGALEVPHLPLGGTRRAVKHLG